MAIPFDVDCALAQRGDRPHTAGRAHQAHFAERSDHWIMNSQDRDTSRGEYPSPDPWRDQLVGVWNGQARRQL
jgi:hypothetical protein